MSRRPHRLEHVDRVVDLSGLMSVTKSPPGGSRPKKGTLEQLFGGLGGLAFKISRAEYVSGEELAAAIEADPGEILPDIVREYLCRYLRGKAKKKAGPKKSEIASLTEIVAEIEYKEELRRLQAARKARGGRMIKGEPAPHEQAAKIIQRRFKQFRMMTPRRVANILSSRKSRR